MNPEAKEKIRLALGRLARDRQDQEAWRVLFVYSWAPAMATAHRVLRGLVELAEDTAQAAFLRIVRYADFGQMPDPDAFISYVKAISRNVALDVLKSLASERGQLETEAGLPLSEFPSPLPSPEETYLVREFRGALLGRLGEEDRKLLELLVEGYTLGEISEKLGVNYSATGVRVHRLRDRLRNYLKERHLQRKTNM